MFFEKEKITKIFELINFTFLTTLKMRLI